MSAQILGLEAPNFVRTIATRASDVTEPSPEAPERRTHRLRRSLRTLALPMALVVASLAALLIYAPIGLLALLLVTLYLARRRSSGAPRREGRGEWLRLGIATVAVWLALAFIWLIVLVSATVGGECTYEEVRCSSAGEFLSDYGGWGFLAILPLALLFAWWWTSARQPERH